MEADRLAQLDAGAECVEAMSLGQGDIAHSPRLAPEPHDPNLFGCGRRVLLVWDGASFSESSSSGPVTKVSGGGLLEWWVVLWYRWSLSTPEEKRNGYRYRTDQGRRRH